MILTNDFKDARLHAIAGEPQTIYPVTAADLLRQPDCLACDSGDVDIIAQVFIGRLEVFTTAVCRQCGYVWRSVTPNEAWFISCASLIQSVMSAGLALENGRALAYERRLEFLGKYVKVKQALDVGAAHGTGMGVLQQNGYQAFALEPNPVSAEYINTRYGVVTYRGTIAELLEVRANVPRYGLVMLCHVLEHCRDPKFVLANLHRLLLPEGVAYVEVPSFGIINWSDAFYLAHMSNFTHTSFERLLKHVGSQLEVVASRFFIHESNRADIGLVLGKRTGIVQAYSAGKPDIDYIQQMYRAGLPHDLLAPGVIKYRVPHFDHFNYGLRWPKYSMRRDGEFIVIVGD